MLIDEVKVFLRKGAENFSDEEIKYCVEVAKSKFPPDSLLELELQFIRGAVHPKYYIKGKNFKLPTKSN